MRKDQGGVETDERDKEDAKARVRSFYADLGGNQHADWFGMRTTTAAGKMIIAWQ